MQSIDELLKMEGRLVEHFDVNEHFRLTKEDEVITFDGFYDILSKWAITQKELDYDDFGKHEDEAGNREEELEAFKKHTDRIV